MAKPQTREEMIAALQQVVDDQKDAIAAVAADSKATRIPLDLNVETPVAPV